MTVVTANDITVRQRILLHLGRFPGITPADEFNIPFDLTQDGIASVVGITRAHASIELKKMTDSGLAVAWQAHMRGTRSRRLAYCLQPAGFSEAARLQKEVMQAGMDVDTLLDMKRCDAGSKWDSLAPADRDTFGKACVMRVPIPRNVLPPTPSGVIPTDFYGVIQIPRDVAKSFLLQADPAHLRSWHSWAADWWLTEGDDQERLYHLTGAGRLTEAARLAVNRSDQFLRNANEGLLEILRSLPTPAGYEPEMAWLEAEVALACGNRPVAAAAAAKLADLGAPEAALVQAQTLLANGQAQQAYDRAARIFAADSEPQAAVTAVRALIALGREQEAELLVGQACQALKDANEATGIDDLLVARAGIAYAKGDREEALKLLSKAQAAAPAYARPRTEALSEGVRAGRQHLNFG